MVLQVGSLGHWGSTEASLWWLNGRDRWPRLRLQPELSVPLDKKIPLFKKSENCQTR